MIKKQSLLILLCAGTAALMSTSINASLIDRGNGLIYDPDLDITWMRNASFTSLKPRNTTNKQGAMEWVDALSFAGFDDWRLPGTLNVDPGCGTDATGKLFLTLTACSGGEMGHLLYGEGMTFTPTPGNQAYGSLSLGNEVFFENVYGGGYWTSEDYVWTGQSYEDPAGSTPESAGKPYPRVPLDGYGWLFYFGGDPGGHKTLLRTGNSRGAWAVRNGDVTAVPLPAAVWLFGSGLLGLAGLARRRAAYYTRHLS